MERKTVSLGPVIKYLLLEEMVGSQGLSYVLLPLQPIAPNPSIPESQEIYDEHIKVLENNSDSYLAIKFRICM